MTNLDELEALARAATQGEWETRSISRRFRPVHEILGVFGKSEVVANMDGIAVPDRMNDRSFEEDAANMRFIAAANPATVRSLIAEVRKAQQERDDFLAMLLHAEDEWLMMAEDEGPRGQGWQSQELEEFRAKIKALRARTALGDTNV